MAAETKSTMAAGSTCIEINVGHTSVEPISLMKKLFCEFIGTFFLGWTIVLSAGQGNQLAPLAIGWILSVMVFAMGHVSGGHYNPAVTAAVAIRGKISLIEAAAYTAVQVTAALAAGALGRLELEDMNACVNNGGRCDTGGYPMRNPDVNIGFALLNEVLWTFALATVVLNVATTKAQHGNSFFGLAIGFTVAAGAISSGAISGGAFNPAIGIGLPAVFGHGEDIWMFIVGPMAGGLLAGLNFRFITSTADDFE